MTMPLPFSTNPDLQLGPSSIQAGLVTSDTPQYKAPLYHEMYNRWEMCRDVFAGTEAIRANSAAPGGKNYLPQHPAEDDDEYQLRTGRAEMFPGFQHSVKGLTSIVFRNDPELQSDVPKEIADQWENIDGAGNHGSVFARNVFEEAMTVGHSLILVDMPVAPQFGRRISVAEERGLGLHPYWTHISPEQVYSWRTEVINGVVTLTQIVIHEQLNYAAGIFAVGVMSRYRVLRYDHATGEVTYEIWDQTMSNLPEFVESGFIRGVNRIPIVVVYAGQRRGPLHSMPPLLDLAYANIAHTQVLCDHRYALYLASVPLLVFKGRPAAQLVNDDGTPKKTTIGPNVAIDVSETGDVKYVEHSGNALGQTRQELKDLETRMATLGLAMLQHETRAAETAEAKRIDKSEKDATIATAARSLIDALETAMDYHAQFLGYPPGSGGSIYMDLDFNIELMDAQTMQAIIGMVSAGQLSLQTMWELFMNRGVLPEDLDTELELTRIESSGTPVNAQPIPAADASPPPATATSSSPPAN
jgi:hypothetical protein